MLFFASCLLCHSLVVVLQFDGSFRPPKDEQGFARLPARMAVCSSSIHIIEQRQNEEEDEADDARTNKEPISPYPIAVGSRSLPIPLDMTSAHTEYEGLILGLDRLCNNPPSSLLSPTTQTGNNPSGFGHNSSDTGQEHMLWIQGDCKAVIDSINGKSQPRKLRHLHQRVQDFMEVLLYDQKLFSTIHVKHIPRSQNSVTDNLCGNHMTMASSEEWNNILNDLEKLKNCSNNNVYKPDQKHQNKVSQIFNRCIAETSYIRYSYRPILHSKIALLAKELKDYGTLLRIGEQLVEESRLLTHPIQDHKGIVKIGVQYQLDAMKHLKGFNKKATALERKHRVLLAENKKSTNDDIIQTKEAQLLLEESVVNISPSWDESIRPEWNDLLNRWWETLRYTELLPMNEGCPIWVDSNFEE